MTNLIIRNIKYQIKIKKLAKKKILICGLTYKKMFDLRNSLSLKIYNKIKKNIRGYDPLINEMLAKKHGLIYNKKILKNLMSIYFLQNTQF